MIFRARLSGVRINQNQEDRQQRIKLETAIIWLQKSFERVSPVHRVLQRSLALPPVCTNLQIFQLFKEMLVSPELYTPAVISTDKTWKVTVIVRDST